MLWAVLTILATLIWSVLVIVDKYILTKWIKNPVVPLVVLGPVGLVGGFLVYVFHGFSYLSNINIVLALVSGVLFIMGVLFYFKAVKLEEISRVVALFYLSPLFVTALAAIFLGELFTPVKYLGIFLLVTGAILISSKNLKFGFGKALLFIVVADFLIAVTDVITKYLLNFADFWTVFAYSRFGTVFALLPIFYFHFPELLTAVKKHGKKVVCVMGLNETANLLGILLIIIAYSVGFVTLVTALSSVQPFFVLLIALFLSAFYPKILKEEIGKSTVLVKLVAIVIMFAGVILIT